MSRHLQFVEIIPTLYSSNHPVWTTHYKGGSKPRQIRRLSNICTWSCWHTESSSILTPRRIVCAHDFGLWTSDNHSPTYASTSHTDFQQTMSKLMHIEYLREVGLGRPDFYALISAISRYRFVNWKKVITWYVSRIQPSAWREYVQCYRCNTYSFNHTQSYTLSRAQTFNPLIHS